MPENNQEIEIRSEEVQEILNKVPNWMIRWGNTLFLGLIIMLLFITWFVKYPDVISTQVMVTTSFPPEKIYAKSTGQFEVFLTSEAKNIEENEILAVIENSADYKDVLLLKSIVDTINRNQEIFSFPIDKLPALVLGDITTSFSQFENDYSEYVLNEKLTPYKSESFANRMSVIEAKGRLQILLSQKDLNKKELEFKEIDLNRSKKMFTQGVISAKEKEQKEIELLQSRRAYKSLEASISQIRELINNSSKNLEGTSIKKTQNDSRLKKKAIQSFLYLKKSLKDWEKQYALTSSINGKVSFLSFWNANQTVKTGELIFTIIPTKDNSYIGKIKAPATNSGKIKKGQKVQIKLLNYPSDEFGELNGKILSISQIPDEKGNYLIDVELPQDLKTTYGKVIYFRQEMKGTADIVTEDLRLIERFFYQLRNIVK
ncbi:HlyD family secretion protein [Tenacibaculum finnmarkense]|uniref:HlyD family secretion protein n=1 Tax=Tenacibaculum finnmarkense TaxID=2781243 RepID=UPI001E31330A|nr:HlyD family secretion protein [Tenacibaculum finnmarkense]MCD8413435.1 HlyD family efflux transporter periplasmic adaptor subunit [Tenacibaculum finnmarkense genomovar ulcerans]MCG8207430.1 HlyD family efflux transporter periplasmic adaptor subunit [Tenacibaculum finnmarkense genomovar finnmarkense]MCG8723541.1 HlyD family efflux transporter periplasmic adaptor subunit [Tenacibaculum finnmarkense]MCG8741774.1 HlyD family efflux transporter periplasmic adaptor subunit [Tenacibaculum finnmarke